MEKTLLKLRLFGIAAFLLFFISAAIRINFKTSYFFGQVQQVLAFTAFAIFGILILFHAYRYYMQVFGKPAEEEA